MQDYLNDQLAFLDTTPEQDRVLRHLIAHIDENGYLTAGLEEVAQSYEGGATVEEVEEALRVVQKLDPPGVGARSLKECLLLQLTPETPHRDIVRVLILKHLEDIRHNRLPAIQKQTGFDLNAIKEAIEVLRHLNLHPGAQFTAEKIPYVVPDLVVERNDDGDYDIRLLDDWLGREFVPIRLPGLLYDLRLRKGTFQDE